MPRISKLLAGAGVVIMTAIGAVTYAQENPKASVSDPPGPLPDPHHIQMTVTKDVVFEGRPEGEQHHLLFGDPKKPGPYGMLIRWNPGHYSHPHMHDQDRYACVISGTWWVSSSNHYDPKLTYPVTAGNCGHHPAMTVHWDGARDGGPPAILYLAGMGPVKSFAVDENGKPRGPAK